MVEYYARIPKNKPTGISYFMYFMSASTTWFLFSPHLATTKIQPCVTKLSVYTAFHASGNSDPQGVSSKDIQNPATDKTFLKTPRTHPSFSQLD